MEEQYKNFFIGVGFLVLGIIFLAIIVPAEIDAMGEYSFGLPPDFFPKVVGWVMVVLSAILIIQAVVNDRSVLRSIPRELRKLFKTADLVVIRNVVVVFLACLGYFFLLQVLPFIVVSPIYSVLLGLFLALNSGTPLKKRVLQVVTTSITTSFIILLTFEKLLQIRLP